MTKTKISKTKPLSVRFTEEEHAALEAAAKHKSKSAFVRDCALREANHKLRRRKDIYIPSKQRSQIAQVLALLGRSATAANLADINRLAQMGALPLSPEIQAQIREACNEIVEIRKLLLQALGLKVR